MDTIIAIGTLILAAVALFQDHMRSWLKSPHLDVTTGSVFPYCLKLLFRHFDKEKNVMLECDGYGLRIAVKNSTPMGRLPTPAEGVEVYAEKLLRKGNDGKFHPVEGFEPCNLIWSHSFGAFIRISPGMTRHCFVGRVLEPKHREHFYQFDSEKIPAYETCLRIDTEVPRHTKHNIIPKGTYRIECMVGASNTKPCRYCFEVCHSGKWKDDESEMFQNELTITQIPM